MQDRTVFWENNWTQASKQGALFLNRPYCKGVQLPESDFADINGLVFKIIYNSFAPGTAKDISSHNDHEGILQALNATSSFSITVKEQLDVFAELEQTILHSFEKLGFTKDFVGIQFPVDVRVVHSVPPPKYLERKDAVDYMHADAWRGEPPDIVNVVLYCAVSDRSSQLATYDVPAGSIGTFEAYTGSEADAQELVKGLNLVEFNHRPGQAIFFDGYTPHYTKRNGDEIRISLNFSFHRGDPYETLDDRWQRARQPWGKYWYMPETDIDTFSQRCDGEFQRLTTSGKQDAWSWRKKVIDSMLSLREREDSYAG